MRSLPAIVALLLVPLIAQAEKVVVVLPMRTFGADASRDWIADAVREDLQTEIERQRGVRLIDPPEKQDAVWQGAEALIVGKAVNADVVVYASVQLDDAEVRVTGKALDVATGQSLGVMVATGSILHIFELENKLSDQVLSILKGQQKEVPLDEPEYRREAQPDPGLSYEPRVDPFYPMEDSVAWTPVYNYPTYYRPAYDYVPAYVGFYDIGFVSHSGRYRAYEVASYRDWRHRQFDERRGVDSKYWRETPRTWAKPTAPWHSNDDHRSIVARRDDATGPRNPRANAKPDSKPRNDRPVARRDDNDKPDRPGRPTASRREVTIKPDRSPTVQAASHRPDPAPRVRETPAASTPRPSAPERPARVADSPKPSPVPSRSESKGSPDSSSKNSNSSSDNRRK